MLKNIIEIEKVSEIAYSNSIIFALRQSHYILAEYLLSMDKNNILAYDYLLKNKEYSNECQALFEKFSKSMSEYGTKCRDAGKILY
jgi:hypothetical protein